MIRKKDIGGKVRKIWVKINEDGSLGRAYTTDQMNFNATPPSGIVYVECHLTGIRHGKEREDSNQDTETNSEVSESTSSDESVQGQNQIYSEGET